PHGFVGHRNLVGVVSRSADQRFLGFELGDAALVHPGDHAFDLGHDLGADAVAGKQKQIDGWHIAHLPKGLREVLSSATTIGKAARRSRIAKPGYTNRPLCRRIARTILISRCHRLNMTPVRFGATAPPPSLSWRWPPQSASG